MFTTDNTLFVLIDVQGNLAQAMYGKDELFSNLQKLVSGMRVLNVPVIWFEQVPERMGPTIPELATLLESEAPIAKASFSCCGVPDFEQRLERTGRKQVVIAGIEAHVCVYQTAVDLLDKGYSVEIVGDAVSSRVLSNKEAGLAKVKDKGAGLTSTEMILLELLRGADHPCFKEILKLIK